MELKDIVLSTLAEIDEKDDEITKEAEDIEKELTQASQAKEKQDNHLELKEEIFLKNLKERILVLFEGFKSPNNKNIEAKVELTLNFLEYLLATIDERLKESADKK
ncbi:MAG: hypothetical protein GXO12_05615 [Epsilonproteobacteria bacterium]|nr:hypothetical protein [Campylobacterota bacterium]